MQRSHAAATNQDADLHTHGYAYGNFYVNSNRNANGHRNTDTYLYRNGDQYTDCDLYAASNDHSDINQDAGMRYCYVPGQLENYSMQTVKGA